MISAEFLITSFIVVLMPGTGVLYTVATGLFQGRKASMLATQVRHYIIQSQRFSTLLQRIFAGSFAALGLKLALTEQH